MSDLVKRLRNGAAISRDRNIHLDYAKIADEAADRIKELERELAEARAAVAEQKARIDALMVGCEGGTTTVIQRLEALDDEIERLKAENSKLRAALAIVHFKQEPLQ